MKLIIAGSRNLIVDEGDITNFMVCHELEKPSEVVCGCARGVDKAGASWAKGLGIPVKHFPADWEKHGKSAGPIRNAQMAHYGDALLLIWDGESKGSTNMKKLMEYASKPVYEIIGKQWILSEK